MTSIATNNTEVMALRQINIAARRHKSDPFPFYARLREERPVCPVTLPDGRVIWLVTRYDDVAFVLSDDMFVKNLKNAPRTRDTKAPWVPRFAQPLTRSMLHTDRPDHGRLRGLVNKAFSPRLVEKMRDRIESLTDELLGQIRGQQTFDLIADFAQPIPTTIIAEMLGVPSEDRARFSRWSNSILQVRTTRWGMLRAVPDVWMFIRYIRQCIRRRQTDPQDDLLSELVHAELDGDRLSSDELVAMVALLLVAGHETTVNLIGNGVLALLQDADQLQLLRDDPSLMPSAVEEFLRYGSPVEMATERWASQDVTISDVLVPAGSLVGAVIASANRDDRQFADPDQLDLSRDPNKHLAFGLGAHYCTGAALARLEGQIAIRALLEQIPRFELNLAPDALRWRPGLVTRGLESLPVRVVQ